MIDFKLPELGENIESGTVLSIAVAEGDTVKQDQDLFELETDKATLPVPSPSDGVIKEVSIKVGDEVKVGQVVIKIEAAAGAGPAKEQAPEAVPEPVASQPEPEQAAPAPEAPAKKDIHVVVLGGGPGGYAAAFMAADLGLKVSLVELDENPGGVCLYRGCIPSKALLHAAKIMTDARDAKEIGLEFGDPKIDLDKLRTWKNDVVSKMTGGLGQLSKQRKVNFVQGRADFIDSNTLNIQKPDGSEEKFPFDKCIIAAGSRPIELPFAPKSERIIDSTGALEIENIPKSMLLVGGGVIGLELGSVYAEFGSEVDCVEMLPNLVPGGDKDIVAVLEKTLKKNFQNIMLNTKVTAMDETSAGIKVTFEDKDGEVTDKEYEKVLVAIGRKPNADRLSLENTKVHVKTEGFIEVNAQMLTTDPSIYAIGDIVGNPMLAHKASHEGIVAAEAIAGHKVAFEPNCIPSVVYTDPELAWCGLTETEAKEKGVEHEVTKFPWAASGRATTMGRNDGLTKLIIDPKTERILGVAMAGTNAGELIAEGVLAIEMGATATDLKLSIHPHPTLSETIMESAESFFGTSTHIYRPKKK